MTAYYNEFDPFAAQWLRNLIDKGLIARGDVDTRSIRDVAADDLRGYRQCHFFAGIGGWSLAFRIAGLPDDFAAWSGSCPCQPYSSAGKQKGDADDRDLWPVWFPLIRERRPAVVFGEQVASAIRFGWLDRLSDDLEGEEYAIGAAVLRACSVSAPHERARLWFVADAEGAKFRSEPSAGHEFRDGQLASALAYGDRGRFSEFSERDGEPQDGERQSGRNALRFGNVADRDVISDFWAGEWRQCADGKTRLVKPSVPLLAHGVSGRGGKLRGFGNAIVPQVAAEFIAAWQECAP